MMKTLSRPYSNHAHPNGSNGRTFAGNGHCANIANGREPQSQKDLDENGANPLPAQLATGLAGVGRQFLPKAAGRSESAWALPGRAASENEIVLFYCISGRGWCDVEGGRREIMPGQLLVVPAKVPRTFVTYGNCPWSLIWVQLAVVDLNTVPKESGLSSRSATLATSEKAEMLALFQETLQALDTSCPQRVLQVSERATRLLHRSGSTPAENSQTETDSATKIGRSVDYMKEHLDKPLRAATLAAIASMSLPHYFAQFKRIIGSSPIDYLIKLRMEHARRLLAETSWSVKEVAVSLGYDDPLYFSRVFKSVNRTAPSDFRARKRNAVNG